MTTTNSAKDVPLGRADRLSRDRGPRTHEAIRRSHRRRRSHVRSPAGTTSGPTAPARARCAWCSGSCVRRLGHRARPAAREPGSSRIRCRRCARSPELPSAANRQEPPPGARGSVGIARRQGRRGARDRRPRERRAPQGRRVLAGHAPAAGPRRSLARRSAGARARRAGQRPRPARHQVLREFLRWFSARGTPCSSRATFSLEMDQMADEVVVIDHGRLVRQGAVADLTSGRSSLRVSSPITRRWHVP